MFKSFKHLNLNSSNSYEDKSYIFEIIDEDFSCEIEVKANAGIWKAIIDQYSKRKLNIGLNLALATIWYSEDSLLNINVLVDFQNMTCPKCVENWSEISKHRDEHLKKWITWL